MENTFSMIMRVDTLIYNIIILIEHCAHQLRMAQLLGAPLATGSP